MRLGLHRFDCEIDVGNRLPRLAQIVEDDPEQTVEQLLLDLGDVALNVARAFALAAEEHLEDREHQRGVEFHHAIAVVRAQPE